MPGRIIEIANDNRHLCVERGFFVVKSRKVEVGRFPLDDVLAVIVHGHGITYTNNLLVRLAANNAVFVLCNDSHSPVGMLMAIGGNYEQARRFSAQIESSKPLKKRIWKQIVKAKISQQAAVLNTFGLNHKPVQALVSKVKVGDPGNIEAQAARRYWQILFGDKFRRERSEKGINALLNYGYTVFRAATARSVLSAGLHPTLGLHHSNQGNPMQLVDDLIEPFRPIVDRRVYKLASETNLLPSLNGETKKLLVNELYADMDTGEGKTPVTNCMQKAAISLSQVFLSERSELELPHPLATK